MKGVEGEATAKAPKRKIDELEAKIVALEERLVNMEKLMDRRCISIGYSLKSHQSGINETHRRITEIVKSTGISNGNVKNFMNTTMQMMKGIQGRVDHLELQENLFLEQEDRKNANDGTTPRKFDFDVKDWGLPNESSPIQVSKTELNLKPKRQRLESPLARPKNAPPSFIFTSS